MWTCRFIFVWNLWVDLTSPSVIIVYVYSRESSPLKHNCVTHYGMSAIKPRFSFCWEKVLLTITWLNPLGTIVRWCIIELNCTHAPTHYNIPLLSVCLWDTQGNPVSYFAIKSILRLLHFCSLNSWCPRKPIFSVSSETPIIRIIKYEGKVLLFPALLIFT